MNHRMKLLVIAALALAGIGWTATHVFGGEGRGDREQPMSYGFKIDIDDCPSGSSDPDNPLTSSAFTCSLGSNVQSVEISDLVLPAVENWDGRSAMMTYTPGRPEPVRLTFKLLRSNESVAATWWQSTVQGQNDRRTITIGMQGRDGDELRAYNFVNCTPVSYAHDPISTHQGVLTETLVVEAENVQLGSIGTPQSWSMFSGGIVSRELGGRDSSFRQAAIRIACTTGKSHDGLSQWAQQTLEGQTAFRNVAMTLLQQDGSDGETTQFPNCFFHRYVFPTMDVTSNTPATEAIELHPYGGGGVRR